MRKAVVLVLVFAAGSCGRRAAPADMATAGPPAGRALVQHGQQVYVRYCATCHGPAANGYAADNAPSLRTPTFLASASDAFLRAGIERGRPGTAMAAFGRAFGGPLAPGEVDALLAFVRNGASEPREPLPSRPPGDAGRGRVVYDANCARCHGTPAQRQSAVHLVNPVLLATATDGFLRFAIENGRPPTSMVPWKDVLTPAQIDDVIGYLRSLPQSLPAPAVPAPPPPGPPAAPRTGPVVLNPKGRAPEFQLKDGLYVSIDQVKQALDARRRLVIADARPPSDWSNMHIKGAISTPYYDLRSLDDIPKDGTWVLAYCACPHHVSGIVVEELRKRGYP
ncbi:MAG TPA: c-type cytochrome, partial [Polyangia bacterium]|nr:c-type cytochrome [Polyangia bacterium]